MGRVPLHDGGFISWDEIGKEVTGVFVGFKKGSKEYGEKPIIVLQTAQGKVALATPTTLESAFQGVQVGTQVEIKYTKEDAPKKKGQSGVKHFEVFALTD
jgi:hypothetical protein